MSVWPDGLVPQLLTDYRPAPLAVIATVDADGAPHAVPVWFRWDGDSIVVWSGVGRRWVRNLDHDPRVAVSVALDQDPYPGVLIRGWATVLDAGLDARLGEAVDRDIIAITRRYVPPEGVSEYIANWPDLRTIVRIVPTRIATWGAAEPDSIGG